MITKTFSSEIMRAILNGSDANGSVISKQFIDQGRWLIHYTLIFSYGGRFYRSAYSQGSTENQEEWPWEHKDDVVCTEVETKPVTVTHYVDKEPTK